MIPFLTACSRYAGGVCRIGHPRLSAGFCPPILTQGLLGGCVMCCQVPVGPGKEGSVAKPSALSVHPSLYETTRSSTQSDECGKGMTRVSCVAPPPCGTPWRQRCWLGFKINWVSIFFPVPGECLSIQPLGVGSCGTGWPFRQVPSSPGQRAAQHTLLSRVW